MASIKKIQDFTGQKTELVDLLISQLEKAVSEGERRLLIQLSNRFIAALQVKNGVILNNSRNKAMLAVVDNVFNNFALEDGLKIMRDVVKGVGRVIDFNVEYFSGLTSKTQVAPIKKEVVDSLTSWLGITDKGTIQANGYLDKLIKDSSVRNQVKDLVIKEVITQSGVVDTTKRLNNLIAGEGESLGALKRYYKNFVNDTYSIADRVVGMQFKSKFGYNFAIYEGGLIKTSRKFCIDRNGKVFHTSEIAKFNPTEAKPPNYNPFTDLGGYNCRHHLNWIPDEMAFVLRPDAEGKFFSEDLEDSEN